jgi:hypothetical protein
MYAILSGSYKQSITDFQVRNGNTVVEQRLGFKETWKPIKRIIVLN